MFRILILFLSFCIHFQSNAQTGCTDPQATNFSPTATLNDGSCVYPATAYSLNDLAILPSLLEESSGLSFLDGNIWTHNDGGNEDKIYRIDSLSGNIQQEVLIATADNNDWEDLTESNTHIFIGDFGNNPGNRMDLAIHRIDKNALNSNIVNSEVINFSYSDQTSFPNLPNNNNYDCEAFFFHNDSLHLFSKNWVNQRTRHYSIPNTPGTHVAQLKGEFDVQGLISAAAIDESGNVILLGYSTGGSSFMWLLHDYQGTNFFSGNKRFVSLGSAVNTSQIEGITFKYTGYGYVSAEKFSVLDPKLFSFDINHLLNGVSTDTEITPDSEVAIYPNPFDTHIILQLSSTSDYNMGMDLIDSNGRIVVEQSLNQGTNEIKTKLLSPGFYFLRIWNGDEFVIKKVVK